MSVSAFPELANMLFLSIVLFIIVIIVIRCEIKKNRSNMLRYIVGIGLSLLFSFLPILLTVPTNRSIESETILFSLKTELSIMIIYLSTIIPQYICKQKSIEIFREQAYGVAMEMSAHTGCNYQKLTSQMDRAIEYYDAEYVVFRCSEESRIAFLGNQVRRFVYLCALDYVRDYVEEDMERKSVEEYCVLPPYNTRMDYGRHIKEPFWNTKSSEAGFRGFGLALTLIVVWLHA